MIWIPQIDAYFSHVVSQWTYCWLELPYLTGASSVRMSYSDIRPQFLKEYLAQRWAPGNPVLPWMQRVQEKNLSESGLVSLVFEQIQVASSGEVELLDYYHSDYPALLRSLRDPPNLLMARGSLELLHKKSVAIVGSRKASLFALEETKSLAFELARAGYVIVSGGAIGCDMAAHLGALHSHIHPAPTILVFAGGLSRLYPRCHQAYFQRLLAQGALCLSERLWSYPARPFDFPVRNRIISGLALRLLVMQAAERSGARLTAHLALEQGREVFVLNHADHDIRAAGSKALRDEGALSFDHSEDYLAGFEECAEPR